MGMKLVFPTKGRIQTEGTSERSTVEISQPKWETGCWTHCITQRSAICTHCHIWLGWSNQAKWNEQYMQHARKEGKCLQSFSRKNLKETDSLKDQGTDGRIILKLVWKN